MGTNAPKGRTNRGLLPQQHEFLIALKQAGGSLDKALKKCGFRRERYWRWLRLDADFQREYNAIMGGSLDATRKVMEAASLEAASTLVDAQEAKTALKVSVTCPKCGKEFDEYIPIEDWKVRIKAAETLLKGAGAIVDRKKVDVDIRELNYGEMMALLLLQGDPSGRIPPAMLAKFREQGLLPVGRGEVIEAEVREVMEDEMGTDGEHPTEEDGL
jgi:hypothetical protein